MLALVAAAVPEARAQVTNWVAYNDHRPGPLIPPHVPNQTNWGTGVHVGTLNMGAPADTTGNLINYLTGDALSATVTFTRTGSPDDFGTVTKTGLPNPGSDAHRLFYGICDLSNDGIVGVDFIDSDFVTISFANLDASKRYIFRGTGGRAGGYVPRWTVATIDAQSFIDAHLNGDGTGFGVITSNDFPANLQPGQAAWNSGHNKAGAVLGWDFVEPKPDGTFSIVLRQYVGPIPGGQQATDANYGYSFGAMLLAEVTATAPSVTAHPAAQTTVEQNRSFTLSVEGAGSPLLYQWYKEGVGPVPGATFRNFTVAQAALTDSGDYYAVIYNPLGRATSSVARVTVTPDTFAPGIATAVPYPRVDNGAAIHDQIIIEFTEPVQASSVSSPTGYRVPGGGNPVSVVVTNDRTVILTLASPLNEDTEYAVTASGMVDAVGNTAGDVSKVFRSWLSAVGNGLVFEVFDTGPGVEVTQLTDHPSFPNSPTEGRLLGVFDTRSVFPNDDKGDYGGRIRGVFIPPVSGDWLFYLRAFDRGVVYLNPNGLDPAGAIEILRESTGNNPRNWDKFTSPVLSLRAGQGYYIEALYKADASSVDVIKVAARLAGTGFPLPVDSLNTEVDVNAISGAAIGYPAAPRDFGGPLSIVSGPSNLTIEENHTATFSVQLNNPSRAAVFYQWFRDGAPITSGGNGPTYSIRAASGDSGATFSVQVSKIGSSASSGSATLTVVPDTTPPQVVSVTSPATNLTEIVVVFDELMDPVTSGDSFNFNLREGPTSESATLESDGKTVRIRLTAPLVQGNSYFIDISNVADIAGLSMNATAVEFTAGVVAGPQLAIERNGANAVVSWPASVTGFTLEQADSIVLPVSSIAWSPVGTAPTVVNGRNTVTVTVSGNKVFRLRQ